MPPTEVPATQDARDLQRQRLLAGRDAATVLVTAGAALWLASAQGGLLRLLLQAATAAGAVLLAASVYRYRMRAWRRQQELLGQRRQVEAQLALALRSDPLTGLSNRRQFFEALQDSVRRVQQGSQASFAVLFLDFDRFKMVNDALGHQTGDELLVRIAGRLRRALLKDTDGSQRNVARFGGDEFLVLLNDVEKPVDAARLANALLKILAAPYALRGRQVFSTASIGIVTSDRCLEDAETIIRNADAAMYEAKSAGRARAVYFSEQMRERLTRIHKIESGLRGALGTSQLSLVYQPIIDMDSGRRTSVEALIRWVHPELGAIGPGEFVPVAEESGLIVPMGAWVLHESCAALARWRRLDADNAPESISVNVSRAELAQGAALIRTVRAALEAAQLPPSCLQLEVTEREVMRDPKGALAVMQLLREIGVRLAMDDFGTGTSSLGCLRDYPFDVIKIDRSFVAGLEGGSDTLSVIHATITLVSNLGKASVAEGVETPGQLAILQSLGCDYAQGYHLGRPVIESQVLLPPAIHDMQKAMRA
ncbi:MAG: EAL domain-containing protein [Steroidobacteraceae bacterium]